nr:stress response kinase A [Enterobacter sp.]
MNINDALGEVQKFFIGFPKNSLFKTLNDNILITTDPLSSQQVCLKQCVIKNPDLFNGFFERIINNKDLLVYQMLPSISGGFIYHYNDCYLYAYKKVSGDTFTFTREKAMTLGRSLSHLHNLLNVIDVKTKPAILENMITQFLSRNFASLSNGILRSQYVLNYLRNNPDLYQKQQSLVHGDMWAQNIITNRREITFIDFDCIRVFYSDYELMRCFFISLIDSIIKETIPIQKYIFEFKGYFESYRKNCHLDLLSAFEFYLFIFCLECEVEDMALHNARMQVFLRKRNALQFVLLKNLKVILSEFNCLMVG